MTFDSMIRHQRRFLRARRAIALAAAAFFAAALTAEPARAQSLQISINDTFVASPFTINNRCSVTTGNGAGANTTPIYMCDITDTPTDGSNISNDPEIQFTSDGLGRCSINTALHGPSGMANPVSGGGNPTGSVGYNVCNDQLFLCAQVSLAPVTGTVALDSVEFEVFRFIDGANPLDPASTPPLKTFFVPSPGSVTNTGSPTNYCNGQSCALPNLTQGYCVLWDGSQNVQGGSAKINGQYGFRVTVQTNQVGASGNITITQVVAYPAATTLDSNNTIVAQKNIQVDVTDVHVIRSTPSMVGSITNVYAEPYNFTYRLSKDATMYININQSAPPFANIRHVVTGQPRVGEGALATTNAQASINSDFWDGRDNFGNLLLPGNYLMVFQADAADQYSPGAGNGSDSGKSDLSLPTTTQIGIDPLQITDIRVSPLLGGATALAVMNYLLTEPATVYIDIYPPGTQFCNDAIGTPALQDVNNTATDGALGTLPYKNLSASIGACTGTGAAVPVQPLRSIAQSQPARTNVFSFWDGRDSNGVILGDGDYVYVIYGWLPSQAGNAYRTNAADKRVWTALAKTGFIPIVRGLVGITQVIPTSTIIGSSPAIEGVSPFTFRYQLNRDALVSLKIYDPSGQRVVKTLVNQEVRFGQFNNVETWSDGTDDSGLAVSSGIYLVQLTAWDQNFPANISTTTAMFPVNLFRITDVTVTPLLSGASDQVQLSYQVSQPMLVAWNIYPAGSVVVGSTVTWPPCPGQTPPLACTSSSIVSPNGTPVAPIITFHGLRAPRQRYTESWNGADANNLLVPDGSYVYTLTAQSTMPAPGGVPFYATDRVEGVLTVARGLIYINNFNVSPDIVPLSFSSNTISLDPFTINYVLTRQSSVTIQVLNTSIPPTVMRTVVSGALRQSGILLTDVWDGRDDQGNFLPYNPGGTTYLVRATAVDVASTLLIPATAQMPILYDPLRIYDLAVTPNTGSGSGAVIAYQVSEPMKVSIKIYKPGTVFDPSGNPQPPDSVSLVRRIVVPNVPSRTPTTTTWDGLDYKMSQVPDGTYKFKIVGSTDSSAIDSMTGNVTVPSELADDRLTDDIPVATNGAEALANPEGYVSANSFVYPNPVTGPTGTFSISIPYRGKVSLKLYTVAGQLVLNKNFGDHPPSYQDGPLTFVWDKTNQGGRTLGRGLYYAVIRIEETEGGANVIQTVKKVLIP